MSLINFNNPDLNRESPPGTQITMEAGSASNVVSSGKPKGLESLFDELKKFACLHFVSDGSWSMYDFLILALEQFERPSNVWITTYSMTELSARVLAKLKDSGKINELKLIMDYKSKMRYPQVDQLIRNVATELALTHLHAKLLIIQNGKDYMTILGSANWTKNPRVEIGVIDKSIYVGLGHIEWITRKMSEANGTE